MKSQQGIGTILILIAIVLASVIAAFLLIQTADQLRTKALNLQKEHMQLLMDRVMIKEVKGVVGSCYPDLEHQCVVYLLIRTSLQSGSNPIDLRKLLMSFTTNDVSLQGIRYIPPEELPYEFNSDKNTLVIISNLIRDENDPRPPACRATIISVMDELARFGFSNAYDISFLAYALDPFDQNTTNIKVGSFYTALWTDCFEKGDTFTLLPNQEIIIFYRPKYPLHPSEPFTIELGTAQGYPVTKDLTVPRGFEGKVVTIFP